MAPPVTFQPHHSCRNFPICVKRSKAVLHDEKRMDLGFCSTCSTAPSCCFAGCQNFSAPLVTNGRSIRYCAEHYRDPSVSEPRGWKLCSNSKLGCSQLSIGRRGGKCFACDARNFPCLYASFGCPRHVRSDPKDSPRKRRACSDRAHHRCPYDPECPSACPTPRCGHILASSQSLCAECSSGSPPCASLGCQRRAAQGVDSYCTPCSSAHQVDPSTSASSHTILAHAVAAVSISTSSVIDDASIVPAESSMSNQSSAHTACFSADLAAEKSGHHHPRAACGNFPVCGRSQKQLFESRSESSDRRAKKVGRASFCSECLQHLADGNRCSHPCCINPTAPTRLRKGPHRFCALHLADPAHASTRTWGVCSHADEGCMFLSVRPNAVSVTRATTPSCLANMRSLAVGSMCNMILALANVVLALGMTIRLARSQRVHRSGNARLHSAPMHATL